jgi:hypothetical protein
MSIPSNPSLPAGALMPPLPAVSSDKLQIAKPATSGQIGDTLKLNQSANLVNLNAGTSKLAIYEMFGTPAGQAFLEKNTKTERLDAFIKEYFGGDKQHPTLVALQAAMLDGKLDSLIVRAGKVILNDNNLNRAEVSLFAGKTTAEVQKFLTDVVTTFGKDTETLTAADGTVLSKNESEEYIKNTAFGPERQIESGKQGTFAVGLHGAYNNGTDVALKSTLSKENQAYVRDLLKAGKIAINAQAFVALTGGGAIAGVNAEAMALLTSGEGDIVLTAGVGGNLLATKEGVTVNLGPQLAAIAKIGDMFAEGKVSFDVVGNEGFKGQARIGLNF